MDVITVTDDAMKAMADLCNKAILVEYDIIFSYPKLIDYISNFEKIEDDQLIHDVEILGRDSLRHHKTMDTLIARLGQQPAWQVGVLPTIVDILNVMEAQLTKEIFARDTYRQVKHIALNNKKKVRVREFFGKIIRVRDGIGEDIITVDEIVNSMDTLIADEERHARIVKDSMTTLTMYLNRMSSK